jgi:mRNA-degrading endonuclease RelE of RelBE toxin-antitoxin system
VKYICLRTPTFKRKYQALSDDQKEAAQKAFQIFKENPFDPRLRAHKIHKLSARYGRTIFSAVIANDLRVLFYVEGDKVFSITIGDHSVYR